MKVLVTGGAGWIGQAVCAELRRRGSIPVIFDRSTGHDITDPDDTYRAVADADAVINLAGVLGTAETIGAERDAIDVNIAGALNVFEAAVIGDVPVVQIGTGHKGQPNPYAITKGAAEDLGLARARYCDQPIVVVRAYHVYGLGQKMCPPHGRSPIRKIVPSFVCRALTGMDMEVNGSGNQLIDLVHVDDVAVTLVDAIGGPYGAVVEAGTGKPWSVYDTAMDIIEATGSASKVMHLPMRPGEPEDSTVVAGAPACPNPWPHRLDETIDWYREALTR